MLVVISHLVGQCQPRTLEVLAINGHRGKIEAYEWFAMTAREQDRMDPPICPVVRQTAVPSNHIPLRGETMEK